MSKADDLPQSAPVIDCAAYRSGQRAADLTIDQIQSALAHPEQFVWLGLYEPDQASAAAACRQQLGLHDLAIEDAINAHQRPKLELYEDSLFVVLRTAQRDRRRLGRLEFGETHVFVGRNLHRHRATWVAAIAHRRSPPLRVHAVACSAKGPAMCSTPIMDFVVDQFLPIVQQIEEDVQDLEDMVFGDPTQGDATARIYHLKRDFVGVTPRRHTARGRLQSFDEIRSSLTFPRIRSRTSATSTTMSCVLNESIDAQRELLSSCPRSPPVGDVGGAERAHEAHHRMGGHDRGPDDDCGHLRDELHQHARAGVEPWLLSLSCRHGACVDRVVRGLPPIRLALSVARAEGLVQSHNVSRQAPQPRTAFTRS